MRPIVLASALLLVLSGCAASEPEVSLPSQTTQTAEATETQTTETQGSEEPAEVSAEQVEESQEPQSPDQDGNDPAAVEPESQESDEPESETSAQAQSNATTEPSPTPTQEPEPTQEATEQAAEESAPEPEIVGYTLAEVGQRNSASDCWVAIDGGVFDLTMWISRHPGGAGAITQLCGTDGTQQFLGMHGGQSRPASTLDGYYIGPLR